jgi:class 3 adenylate cyclase
LRAAGPDGGQVVRSKSTESRTASGPFGALGEEDLSPSHVSERAARLNATVSLGDVQTRDDDVSGLAVNAAARVMALAQPGEVLATESTALAALGADIELTPHGRHSLKGLPGEWALYQT